MNATVQKAKQRFAAFGLLRLRDYRWIFISVGLLTFGYQMRSIAQSWLALELTDSQAWVGIVNGVPALAVILLSLVGGIASDRFPKRDILIWVRAGLAMLAFTVGYLVVAGWIQTWHLVVLALAQGSIVAFGMPANTAIVVEIVGRRSLQDAQVLHRQARTIAVQTELSLPVQADGDPVGATPVAVSVVPRALHVLIPPGAPPGLFTHPTEGRLS